MVPDLAAGVGRDKAIEFRIENVGEHPVQPGVAVPCLVADEMGSEIQRGGIGQVAARAEVERGQFRLRPGAERVESPSVQAMNRSIIPRLFASILCQAGFHVGFPVGAPDFVPVESHSGHPY